MTLVHVICLVVCYYMIKICSRNRIVDRSLTLEKDRVRDMIMKIIATSEGRKIIKMSPNAFLNLCSIYNKKVVLYKHKG